MTNLRKKADKLWIAVIRVINGYKPDDKTVDAHHIRPRWNHSTRYDIKNGYILTRVEHSYFEDHPEEAEVFFRHKLGDKEYDRLKAKSLQIKKWQPYELEDIIKQFKEILKCPSGK